jgi:hypothetical protein
VMLNEEMVSIDPRTRRLDWNQAKWPNYAGEFLRIRQLCETGSLVVFRDKTLHLGVPIRVPALLLEGDARHLHVRCVSLLCLPQE